MPGGATVISFDKMFDLFEVGCLHVRFEHSNEWRLIGNGRCRRCYCPCR